MERIYEFLKIFMEYDSISINEVAKLLDVNYTNILSEFNFIFEIGYIHIVSNENSSPSLLTKRGNLPINAQLAITQRGRIAYENYEKKQKSDKLKNIRDWITLAVAVATLIVTIVNIFL